MDCFLFLFLNLEGLVIVLKAIKTFEIRRAATSRWKVEDDICTDKSRKADLRKKTEKKKRSFL